MSELAQFLSALLSGNAPMVASLIDSGDIDVNCRLETPHLFDCSALIVAAAAGSLAIVDLLLNAGARVNNADQFGETALHHAAKHAHAPVVELLLARGADVSAKDHSLRSPLHFACFHEDDRIALALVKAGAPLDDGSGPFVCQIAPRRTAMLHLLIDLGVDLNQLQNATGGTLCHSAVDNAEFDLPNLQLLGRHVDIDAQDFMKRTCLHVICDSNCNDQLVAALRWLIGAGADIDLVDMDGRTPLFVACLRSNHECVELLLAAGADVHLRDVRGQTALHAAVAPLASFAVTDTVHAIVAAGGDYHALDHAHDGQLEPSDAELAAVRRRIVALRLDFVRARALQVCIGLQSLDLAALQMCEILVHACGPVAPLVAFHHWWQIATAAKHLRKNKHQE